MMSNVYVTLRMIDIFEKGDRVRCYLVEFLCVALSDFEDVAWSTFCV